MFAQCDGFDATLPKVLGRQVRGLNEIRCPVLVLWGSKDVILLPRQGPRFERLIPGSELRVLKGLGHVPMSDDPELLAEAIGDFALERGGMPQFRPTMGRFVCNPPLPAGVRPKRVRPAAAPA